MDLIIIIVFAIATLFGFAIMGIDKHRAKKGLYRIAEKTLFLTALCFGGVGTTLGMFYFRHKTKHWYFRLFMPILAIINVAIAVYLISTF